jgi:hypothetical protein
MIKIVSSMPTSFLLLLIVLITAVIEWLDELGEVTNFEAFFVPTSFRAFKMSGN